MNNLLKILFMAAILAAGICPIIYYSHQSPPEGFTISENEYGEWRLDQNPHTKPFLYKFKWEAVWEAWGNYNDCHAKPMRGTFILQTNW